MELEKEKIIDCFYKETNQKNIDFDHGIIEMYVDPSNDFSCSMTWMLRDINDQFTNQIFLIGIQDYLKEYFKYVASKRIANKLTVKFKDGKIIEVTPSWDQTIVDEFYSNLPVNKRSKHIGWYDKD